MPKYLRLPLLALAVLAVCLPIAIVVTILLSPLWSWIEATYGIESIGHSGPSDWCFFMVYSLVAASGLLVATLLRKAFRA